MVFSVDFETWLTPTLSTIKAHVSYGNVDHRETCLLSAFVLVKWGSQYLPFTGGTAELIMCNQLAAVNSTF